MDSSLLELFSLARGEDCVRFSGVGAAIAVRLRLRMVRIMLDFIFGLLN
jgi:hypothetical protein